MIVSFKDQVTEDIFNGRQSRQARKACPEAIGEWQLDQLDSGGKGTRRKGDRFILVGNIVVQE